ncbi:hypothetical protein R6Q59_023336 [Mikania micrantha]
MAKTDWARLDQYGLSWTDGLILACFYLLIKIEADIAHHDDDAAELLELSQHEWLQFEPNTARAIRCRRILHISVATPRCIDWGVLAYAGQAERARAILGKDAPWSRLFDTADVPTYRLITVEFLSTFRYRAHQAAIPEQEDEELPPDIEFSLCGQHMEMPIERFAVLLGIYYEPETVTDAFTQGLTQEPGVVTTTDLFYLHSLMTSRPCNLTRCFALYYASLYHRQERGTLWGGAFVTHLAHSRGMFHLLQDLPAIEPRKLDRRMLLNMKLAADIPGLGLRFIGSDGCPFQPA